MIDLHNILNRVEAATFETAYRHAGNVDPDQALRLAIGEDTRLTPVLTLGPYRAVGVGRTRRGIPDWLREILQMLHRHCRGPYCDRKTTWSQADHTLPWADLGETTLDNLVPLCQGANDSHHRLVTTGGWKYTADLDSGICTWTDPHGNTIRTHPPRRRPTGPAPLPPPPPSPTRETRR